MSSRCIGHVRTIISIFAATVAFNASALYWKDWDNTGNLANPANWNDKGSQPGEVNSSDVANIEYCWWENNAGVTHGGTFTLTTDKDLTVSYIQNPGQSNLDVTFDLHDHTLTFGSSDYGILVKKGTNTLSVVSGTINAKGRIYLGHEGGDRNVFKIDGGTVSAGGVSFGNSWNHGESKENSLLVRSGSLTLNSHVYMGDNELASVEGRNLVFVGDGGSLLVNGDVFVYDSYNAFVVSNGTMRCNSLHSVAEGNDTAVGTSFTFAGESPAFTVMYFFTLRRESSVSFVVPNGGYSTTPMTLKNGCKVEEDTTLSVDVKGLLRGLRGGERAQIRLINADMDGYNVNKVYVPDDDESFTKLNGLIAKWNASLPSGVRVYLARERCELWLEATKPGLVVSIR